MSGFWHIRDPSQELEVDGNEKLDERAAIAAGRPLSRLDVWWVKQYLAGRSRKRKAGELSRDGERYGRLSVCNGVCERS